MRQLLAQIRKWQKTVDNPVGQSQHYSQLHCYGQRQSNSSQQHGNIKYTTH